MRSPRFKLNYSKNSKEREENDIELVKLNNLRTSCYISSKNVLIDKISPEHTSNAEIHQWTNQTLR